MTQRDPDGERAAVEAVNAQLYAAFERGDADAMAALWVDGTRASSAVCVHPGWEPLHGRTDVLRSWTVIMANTSYVQVFLTDVETTVVGDVAVVTCAEDVLTGMESGGALTGGRAAATNVFLRTSDGWRLWVHHGSPVLAPDEDAETDPAAEDGR